MNSPIVKVEYIAETQYREYAGYDNARKIPNAIDGFKITNRKIFYTMIKENVKKEMKVSQLASLVANVTHYNHGEQSISPVICNMAQDFAGSNNITFLTQDGQFGTRTSPAPASPRYIYTALKNDYKKYFSDLDEPILEHNYEDEHKIEPKIYLPIIPLILVNGGDGIGFGFATNIFPRNPNDIIEYCINMLENKSVEHIKFKPYYNGFSGTIESGKNSKQFIFKGVIKKVNSTTFKIVEAPIGMTSDILLKMLNKAVEDGFIKDYDDDSKKNTFNVTVYAPRQTLELPEDEIITKLKLFTKDSENITLWTHNETLRKFNSIPELMDYFIGYRVEKYEVRRLKQIELMRIEQKLLEEKFNFIKYYLNKPTEFTIKNRQQLTEALLAEGFVNIDRLLRMSLISLTREEIINLNEQIKKIKKEIVDMQNTSAIQIYLKELKELGTINERRN